MSILTVSNVLIVIAIVILFFELCSSDSKIKRQSISILLASSLTTIWYFLDKYIPFCQKFRNKFVREIKSSGKVIFDEYQLDDQTIKLMLSVLFFLLALVLAYIVIRLITLCLFKKKYLMKRVKYGVDFKSFFIHLPLIIFNSAVFMAFAFVLTYVLKNLSFLDIGILKDAFIWIEEILKGGLGL